MNIQAYKFLIPHLLFSEVLSYEKTVGFKINILMMKHFLVKNI